MTVRHELVELIEEAKECDEGFAAYTFLRDRGVALVEALRDAERYRQLLKILDPDMVPGGVTLYYALDEDVDQLVYSDDELNEILDTARGES